MDLVIFYVPENLPVPRIIPAGKVPHWNKLKMKSKGRGRHEFPGSTRHSNLPALGFRMMERF